MVGVALMTAVFAANGSLASAADAGSGFRAALAVSGALSGLGAVIALGVGRARRGPGAQESD